MTAAERTGGPRPAEEPETARPGWARRWRLARGAVVLVVGGVCWALFVTGQQVRTGRMAALVVHRPPTTAVRARPATATVLPVSGSTLAVVRRAGRLDPAHSGIEEIGWTSPAGAKTSVDLGLLVQLLPRASLARQVLQHVRRQYASSRAVGGVTYTVVGHFAVPGVPGAQGLVDRLSATSSTPPGRADIVTFQVGQAAALVLLQTSGTQPGAATAARLATEEAQLLRRRLPGFTLAVPTRPLGPSLADGLASVLGAGVAVIGPEGLGSWRRRRRARREARARAALARERQARGRRAVQRHQPASWRRRPPRPSRRR